MGVCDRMVYALVWSMYSRVGDGGTKAVKNQNGGADEITPDQQVLLDLVMEETGARPPFWKRTQGEFVLEYGWWYSASPLPKGIPLKRGGHCFYNVFQEVLTNDAFIYCEGYALSRLTERAVHHAWLTDGAGRAIDITWSEPATAYAGVPFSTQFLALYHVKNKAVICMLDDWEHGWPMLGQLGDEPDKWYERRGCGVSKLSRSDKK